MGDRISRRPEDLHLRRFLDHREREFLRSFATRVGDVTITQSEFTMPGLTKGQKDWFIVRAIRTNQPGTWSDPATRVAGL